VKFKEMGAMAMDLSPGQLAACQALVYSLLQRCGTLETGKGSVLAFVAAHPGAGVSHIHSLIGQMLNENEANCAIALDCDALGLPTDRAPSETRRRGAALRDEGDDDDTSLSRRNSVARYRDRVGHLNKLRELYRFVLLDCHSLKEKTDVLGLAPLVDGTIVIVECNKTTNAQIDYLERNIETYGGTILGSVLNKTIYPLPKWVNSMMERAGI
jgi:hypothetical protein